MRRCLHCVGREPCSDALRQVIGSLRDLRGSGQRGFSQWRSQHILFAVSGLHLTLSFLRPYLVTEGNAPLFLEPRYQADENERRIRRSQCQLTELGRAVTSTGRHAFSYQRIRTMVPESSWGGADGCFERTWWIRELDLRKSVPERRGPQYLEFDAELSCDGQACFQGAPTLLVGDTCRKLAGPGVQVPTSRLDVTYHTAGQHGVALGRHLGYLDARHLSPYSAELGYRFKLDCPVWHMARASVRTVSMPSHLLGAVKAAG